MLRPSLWDIAVILLGTVYFSLPGAVACCYSSSLGLGDLVMCIAVSWCARVGRIIVFSGECWLRPGDTTLTIAARKTVPPCVQGFTGE